MNDVCYIISATVKISVALVLYRLVERIYNTIRWILIVDITACAIFNTGTTLILALGCMAGTPYTFSNSVCENTNYAQEASYVIWDVFHVVLPVFILWNVQMGTMVKTGVVGLFSVGILYVVSLTLPLPKPDTPLNGLEGQWNRLTGKPQSRYYHHPPPSKLRRVLQPNPNNHYAANLVYGCNLGHY